MSHLEYLEIVSRLHAVERAVERAEVAGAWASAAAASPPAPATTPPAVECPESTGEGGPAEEPLLQEVEHSQSGAIGTTAHASGAVSPDSPPMSSPDTSPPSSPPPGTDTPEVTTVLSPAEAHRPPALRIPSIASPVMPVMPAELRGAPSPTMADPPSLHAQAIMQALLLLRQQQQDSSAGSAASTAAAPLHPSALSSASASIALQGPPSALMQQALKDVQELQALSAAIKARGISGEGAGQEGGSSALLDSHPESFCFDVEGSPNRLSPNFGDRSSDEYAEVGARVAWLLFWGGRDEGAGFAVGTLPA